MCYYWAVAVLPINDTIMVLYLYPVFTTLFAALMLKERISSLHVAALALAMTGILLMT